MKRRQAFEEEGENDERRSRRLSQSSQSVNEKFVVKKENIAADVNPSIYANYLKLDERYGDLEMKYTEAMRQLAEFEQAKYEEEEFINRAAEERDLAKKKAEEAIAEKEDALKKMKDIEAVNKNLNDDMVAIQKANEKDKQGNPESKIDPELATTVSLDELIALKKYFELIKASWLEAQMKAEEAEKAKVAADAAMAALIAKHKEDMALEIEAIKMQSNADIESAKAAAKEAEEKLKCLESESQRYKNMFPCNDPFYAKYKCDMDSSRTKLAQIKLKYTSAEKELQYYEDSWLAKMESLVLITDEFNTVREKWAKCCAAVEFIGAEYAKKNNNSRLYFDESNFNAVIDQKAADLIKSGENAITPYEPKICKFDPSKLQKGQKRKAAEIGVIFKPKKVFTVEIPADASTEDKRLYYWLNMLDRTYYSTGHNLQGFAASAWSDKSIFDARISMPPDVKGTMTTQNFTHFVRGCSSCFTEDMENFKIISKPFKDYTAFIRSVKFLLDHYKGKQDYCSMWIPARRARNYLKTNEDTYDMA